MSRRVENVKVQVVDAKLLAFVEVNGNTFGPGHKPHGADAAGLVAQRPQCRDMVGMNMGIHGHHQFQVQLFDEADILAGVFQHWINQQGFATPALGYQIGVSARCLIEKRAKDHGSVSSMVA